MKIYFAPMEGLTSYIYRRAHHRYYGGIDKYYTPFIAPGRKCKLANREMREIDPKNNEGVPTVPQILGNQAAIVIEMTKRLYEMGYEEINLNLGCPSGTVVSRGRGSGLLADSQGLEEFLAAIYQAYPGGSHCPKLSIKSRLGISEPQEFEQILEIYNQFPVHELTLHPRVQKDFYKKPVRAESFAYAAEHAKAPLCYNGNLNSKQDFDKLIVTYPDLQAVMIGRERFRIRILPMNSCAQRSHCRQKDLT